MLTFTSQDSGKIVYSQMHGNEKGGGVKAATCLAPKTCSTLLRGASMRTLSVLSLRSIPKQRVVGVGDNFFSLIVKVSRRRAYISIYAS